MDLGFVDPHYTDTFSVDAAAEGPCQAWSLTEKVRSDCPKSFRMTSVVSLFLHTTPGKHGHQLIIDGFTASLTLLIFGAVLPDVIRQPFPPVYRGDSLVRGLESFLA